MLQIKPGTKAGQRLLAGCERLRKLLSQLGEAKVTVENLTDSGDMNFVMRRDEFSAISRDLLDRFKALFEVNMVEESFNSFNRLQCCRQLLLWVMSALKILELLK